MSPSGGDATVRGMTRALRTWLAAILAVAAITTMAPSSAARPEPVRSGTITGWGATWVAMFNGDAKDCQWSEWIAGANPECAAWLESRCNPALAGRNPAVTASIVDVRSIADGTTRRVFEWEAAASYPGFSIGGGVVVQLWRKNCTEIRSSKWRSVLWHGPGDWHTRMRTPMTIPTSAAWMTVTTNDTIKVDWTLR